MAMFATEVQGMFEVDEEEVQSRRAYFELGDEDLRRLAALRPAVEARVDRMVEELYELILGHAASRAVFRDQASLRRAQRAQREYFLGLFAGRCDLAYVEDRLRIGTTHERVGVPPKFYLGAYARMMRTLRRHLRESVADPEEARLAEESMEKLVAFDTALAMDTYVAAQLATVERQRKAIRQLSTPLLEPEEAVLLMPLIGSLDAERMRQATDAALQRIREEHARVLILDVAGVPVVDTAVAQDLVRCAHAVRLLGATSILSGLSAPVATTLVHLGVELTALETCGRLSDALALARQRVAQLSSMREAVESRLEQGDGQLALTPRS